MRKGAGDAAMTLPREVVQRDNPANDRSEGSGDLGIGGVCGIELAVDTVSIDRGMERGGDLASRASELDDAATLVGPDVVETL